MSERYRDLPPRPERPSLDEPRPKRGSLLPVTFVLGLLLALFVGVVTFTGVAGLLMMAVLAVFLAIPVLHYLTWGWWLSSSLRDEQKETPPMLKRPTSGGDLN